MRKKRIVTIYDKILADTIITINGRYSYHLEAQMTEDECLDSFSVIEI